MLSCRSLPLLAARCSSRPDQINSDQPAGHSKRNLPPTCSLERPPPPPYRSARRISPSTRPKMASKLANHSIRIASDRGGTFTDVHASWIPVGSDGNGGEGGENGDSAPQRKEITLKLLSVHDHYPDAPREGVRRVLELITGEEYPRDALLPVDKIASIRLSTTVATKHVDLSNIQ